VRIFGLEVTKAAPTLSQVPDSRGWNSILIREPFSGAWQKNEELSADSCLAFHAVFACLTLICSDVAKNRIRLMVQKGDVWQEATNPAFSPVLRKPNGFQNRIQFLENWVNSKLARGNAYILKRRDGRGVVTELYVLCPDRVRPLVSDDGQVFYQLSIDNLADVEADAIVPAREIIHDRFNCLFHPLVGISPLYASALAATHGTNIQRAGARLAANGVRPGGIIVYPGKISPDDAKRVQDTWEGRYSGPEGVGRLAIIGEGAKFESLSMTADEAQLIDQLKYTAEVVCSTFHVPPYKIGIGQHPTYNNVQALNVEYYSQCLQVLFESIELCLDEGLGIGEGVVTNGQTYGTEIDVDNLLRMDGQTLITMLKDGVSAGVYAPNEARAKVGEGPVPGGEHPYLQQQNYSLEALAKRDATDDPFGTAKPPALPPPPANDDPAAAKAMSALVAHSVREKLNARR
jgi:HK97 family phage portal protein